MNLFVANINKAVKEDALKALFSEFGGVMSVRIVTDKYTGESKGFGFVEMKDDHEAQKAVRQLNHAEFFDSKLVVSKAHNKTSGY